MSLITPKDHCTHINLDQDIMRLFNATVYNEKNPAQLPEHDTTGQTRADASNAVKNYPVVYSQCAAYVCEIQQLEARVESLRTKYYTLLAMLEKTFTFQEQELLNIKEKAGE